MSVDAKITQEDINKAVIDYCLAVKDAKTPEDIGFQDWGRNGSPAQEVSKNSGDQRGGYVAVSSYRPR